MSTTAPAKSAATNSEGETIDLRDLTTRALKAYRTEAAQHGDRQCAARCDAILRDRGWA